MPHELVRYDNEGDWLDARRRCITSSDVPPLLGVYPSQSSREYLNPFELWRRKREPQPPDPEMRLRFDIGHLLEDRIADEVAIREGVNLYDLGTYAMVKNGFLAATPDRVILRPEALPRTHFEALEDVTGILEEKTDAVQGVSAWTEGGGKLQYAVVQAHVPMICCEVDVGLVATLFGLGLGLEIFPVVRNEDLVALIKERAEEFMEFILTDSPPTEKYLDSSEAVASSLRRVFERDTGEIVRLGEEWTGRLHRLEEIREQMKGLKEEEQAIKNQAMLDLKEATLGEIPGSKKAWKWATEEKKEYTVPAKSTRVLRLVNQ